MTVELTLLLLGIIISAFALGYEVGQSYKAGTKGN